MWFYIFGSLAILNFALAFVPPYGVTTVLSVLVGLWSLLSACMAYDND